MQNVEHSDATIGRRFMPFEAEVLAARLTRIKTLLDALEPECLENQPSRDTFLKLKQELEAARISVRPVRPIRPLAVTLE